MERNLEFKLVEGVFNSTEAKTIINDLINSKINFHNLEDFSNSIRFNLDQSSSKKRVEQLNEIKSEINRMFAELDAGDSQIELNCNFRIALK